MMQNFDDISDGIDLFLDDCSSLLILGIGNDIRGDDGLGPYIINQLSILKESLLNQSNLDLTDIYQDKNGVENQLFDDDFIINSANDSDDDSCDNVKKHLEAFSGSFSFDIDNDGIENLIVKFSRGRPQEILFDENQDGELEWTVQYDF